MSFVIVVLSIVEVLLVAGTADMDVKSLSTTGMELRRHTRTIRRTLFRSDKK